MYFEISLGSGKTSISLLHFLACLLAINVVYLILVFEYFDDYIWWIFPSIKSCEIIHQENCAEQRDGIKLIQWPRMELYYQLQCFKSFPLSASLLTWREVGWGEDCDITNWKMSYSGYLVINNVRTTKWLIVNGWTIRVNGEAISQQRVQCTRQLGSVRASHSSCTLS